MNSVQNQKESGRRFRRRSASGQSAVELAFALPVFILLLLATADFGRLFYVWIAVNNAARAGAQYGSQSVITAANSAGMILAATTDGSNIASLSATASQCTCISGTSVAVCSGSSYNCANDPQATFVEVDTQAPFHTVVSYPGIPSSITVPGKAILQVSG
jgi:Flp pilus assembly protein TadG